MEEASLPRIPYALSFTLTLNAPMLRWPLLFLMTSACSSRSDPRQIGPDATYAELVQALSQVKDPERGSGCMFTRTEAGIRFTVTT
ncbi:MAG: hypothetical protein ACI8RZ_003183 [Myxococcota bacterium]|jgi:hypothetical protein